MRVVRGVPDGELADNVQLLFDGGDKSVRHVYLWVRRGDGDGKAIERVRGRTVQYGGVNNDDKVGDERSLARHGLLSNNVITMTGVWSCLFKALLRRLEDFLDIPYLFSLLRWWG